jgi:prophage regulatory protein
MNILRYRDAARKVAVSRMTVYRWATQPEYADMKFPKPMDLGNNSVGFVEAEIDAWLEARAAEREVA